MKGTLRLLIVAAVALSTQVALGQSAPVISGLSPSSVIAGSAGFTVTVAGANFFAATSGLTVIPGSVVLWNGSPRSTGFVSSTVLQASVSANDVASPGTAIVTVANPGGAISNAVNFAIIPGNPVPAVAALSPASATAGGPAFSLAVDGSSFFSGSVVRWNGGDRVTTFESTTRLRAAITAADLTTSGTAEISVFSPAPGGGGSGVLTFAIIATGPPRLEVLPTVLTLQAGSGSNTPATQTLRVGNSGGGFVNWTAQVSTNRGGNWLTLSASSGSAAGLAPSQVLVSANPSGLGNGIYSGSITVTGGGSAQVVTVNFFVVPAAPILQVSNTGLRFTAGQGGVATPPQSFTIINAGPSILNWTLQKSTISGGNWLSVSPDSGSSTAGTPFPVVTVSANPTGLGPGAYYGEIRVMSGAVNSPQSVNVVLEVVAGGTIPTQVSPQGLLFVSQAGAAAPVPQTVNVAGFTSLTAAVSASTTGGGAWLNATPTSLSVAAGAGGTLTVSASPGALPPGVYRGTVSLTFSDSTTQAISVMLVLANPGTAPASVNRNSVGGSAAACVPLRLLAVTRLLGGNFTSPVGWPRTIEVQAVDDCGNAAIGATVVANFTNGDPPLVLAGVGGGRYSATWNPGTSADQTTVTIRAGLGGLQEATLQVQGKVAANAGVPLVGSGGIVNAASFAKAQPMAPGGIVSVFGVGMASSTPGAASSLPLPTSLAGATLVIGGVNAPLFYSSSGQINAQIPAELPTTTRLGAFIQLNLPGSIALSLPETIALDGTRPGIFLTGGTQGVVIDVQGRLVDANAPAAGGDVVVIYATGLGETVPSAITGRPAPSNPPAQVTTPASVTIGGVAAEVQFAGLTPGLVGLYQVNARIPGGVATGSAVPLVITQNGVPSNTVTFAVR